MFTGTYTAIVTPFKQGKIDEPALERLIRAQIRAGVDGIVPVGTTGDNWDRFMCRQEEIRQSARIIEQALDQMPDSGPINIDDPRVVLPPKEDVYTTIEGTIQHFKIVMEGIKVPAGECYSYTEAGNGELGFYLVSDGGKSPYRCKIRAPSFVNIAVLPQITRGYLISDLVAIIGSIDIVLGEVDR